jgi:AraC family transcriptional regulator of adaptative response/methylated-DNA-[protein]-cysteine methyltransferase
MLYTTWIETPLGKMVVLADERVLHYLGFEEQCARVGRCEPIDSIEQELEKYFDGSLKCFKTPYVLQGTAFQKQVWEALAEIPFGKTWSYLELASFVGKPTACRAVANANGANPLSILIPCHRVIRHSGELGGYSSGIEKKEWLLAHEQRID